jgi:hypothetical protein
VFTVITDWWKRQTALYRHNTRLFWLRMAYFICLVYVLAFWRAIWTPDLLFVMLLGLFALYGQGRQFLYKFGPFVVLLLAYDSLRGFAPLVNHRVHFMEMINFDRWLTGGILPTAQLQHWWYHGHLSWYDFYFYGLYMCHFVFPLAVALVIWRKRPELYNRYVVAFLLLSYAGFLTYVIFPAAPPWMASEMGLIPAIHKISTDVWWSVGVHDFPSIYRAMSPNLVAAVPSLHAAYPTLITLFILRAFGWRWALAAVWYPISIWLGIVYMGEHYIFDALLGVGYAVGAYTATLWLFRRHGAKARSTLNRVRDGVRRRVGGRTVTTP